MKKLEGGHRGKLSAGQLKNGDAGDKIEKNSGDPLEYRYFFISNECCIEAKRFMPFDLSVLAYGETRRIFHLPVRCDQRIVRSPITLVRHRTQRPVRYGPSGGIDRVTGVRIGASLIVGSDTGRSIRLEPR